MLKNRLLSAIKETIADIDNNDTTIKILHEFLIELSNRSLYCIGSMESLEDIKDTLLGDNQNTYLDFLTLLNVKIKMYEIEEKELLDLLYSIKEVYKIKENSNFHILTGDFIDEVTPMMYGDLDRLIILVLVLKIFINEAITQFSINYQIKG